MKKIIICFVLIAIVFSFCACGEIPPEYAKNKEVKGYAIIHHADYDERIEFITAITGYGHATIVDTIGRRIFSTNITIYFYDNYHKNA